MALIAKGNLIVQDRASGTRALEVPDWQTAYDYIIGDVVMESGSPYVTTTAHTSGVFATDSANWLSVGTAAMAGATTSAAGTPGTAPGASAGQESFALKGDAAFSKVFPDWEASKAYEIGDQVIDPLVGNHLYECTVAHTSTTDLQTDVANWETRTGTALFELVGADGTSAGTGGGVPAPAAADADKILRGDGTWAEKPFAVVAFGMNEAGNLSNGFIHADAGTSGVATFAVGDEVDFTVSTEVQNHLNTNVGGSFITNPSASRFLLQPGQRYRLYGKVQHSHSTPTRVEIGATAWTNGTITSTSESWSITDGGNPRGHTLLPAVHIVDLTESAVAEEWYMKVTDASTGNRYGYGSILIAELLPF